MKSFINLLNKIAAAAKAVEKCQRGAMLLLCILLTVSMLVGQVKAIFS